MPTEKDWYEVIKLKDYLYVIRERLDLIDPRFHTTFTNLFLILGTERALLIDTGCGLFPLKPIISNLVGEKDLSVVNTHSHFDHRGANDEFDTIYIHELELKNAGMPFDISMLRDSPQKIVNLYEKKGFIFQPPNNIKPLKEGDMFDLGELTVEVIHTPGHSTGSISLTTNRGELFTGDSAHYGTMYLPKRKQFPIMLGSILKLKDLFKCKKLKKIYPSHEDFPVGVELLDKLYEGITNIENIWETKSKDRFLHAWILEDENFKYVV